MLTHGNLLVQPRADPGASRGADWTADDVVLGVLPMFHIFGMNVVLGLALYAGASVVLVERFDPATAARDDRDAWRDGDLGRSADVDRVGDAARRRARAPSRPCASRRQARRSCREDLSRLFQSRFGLELLEGYGLTEASPVVTASPPGDVAQSARSACRCPGLDVRLVDADGDDALVGRLRRDLGAGARTSSRATGTTTRRPRTRSPPTAGSAPATWRSPTTRATSTSSTGRRTSSSCRGSTCSRPRSRRCSPSTRASRRSRWSGVPASADRRGGQGLRRGCSRARQPTRRRSSSTAADSLARYKCPTKVMFVDELPKGWGARSCGARCAESGRRHVGPAPRVSTSRPGSRRTGS